MHAKTGELTFWEHLGSLRVHLVWGGVFFLMTAGLSFALATDTLIHFLLLPLDGESLIFLTPLGPFLFKMKVSFFAGLMISTPMWLGLLFHFVGPALPHRSAVVIAAFIFAACLLTILALAGTYFLLVPITLAFLMSLPVPGTSVVLTAESYVSFFFLELAVAFVIVQLPLVINALAYLGLLNPYSLGKKRRHLYLGLLVLLGIVTPTTDVVTLLIVFLPAVLFTEGGLAAARLIHRRRA